MKRAAFAGVIVVVVVNAFILNRPPQPRRIYRSGAAVPSNAIERGQLIYAQYGCALCHGDDGRSGIANPNSETDEKIPPIVFVQEGYTKPELLTYVLKGNQEIGKERADGSTPPYRMPGGLGRLNRNEAGDLVEYLWSLYPEDEKTDKW